MPLRVVKGRKVSDALPMAISITSLAKDLTTIAGFPPATAALSIVLLIFEALQAVQNNKYGCYNLARRCARILLDINEQMDGRWDTAPPSLTRNLERFQGTLTSIHEFMKKQADARWAHRLMRRVSTENAISEFSTQLEEAARSFQIATLIDIHYTVSHRSTDREKGSYLDDVQHPSMHTMNSDYMSMSELSVTSTLIERSPAEMKGLDGHEIPKQTEDIPITGINIQSVNKVTISDGVLEDHGFQRYHQSEVKLKGRSRLTGGWWASVSEAEVEGQSSLIKRYEGARNYALKHWVNDVKFLQNVYHPSLPQMIGFSADDTPIPFILLSKGYSFGLGSRTMQQLINLVQTRSPEALLMNTLINTGLAACVDLILRFYQDVTDATLHIQQQMDLDDQQAQDFVDCASYMVDGSHAIIMGLPPPKGGWITTRSYGLTESLKMIVLSMLPNKGMNQYKLIVDTEEGDITRQSSHLVALIRGLLPAETEPPALSPRATALIRGYDGDDYEHDFNERVRPSLRKLRLSNLEANAHDHVWHENGGIPPHQFTVGDFGYIPKGEDFCGFVILGNLLKDNLAEFSTEVHVTGFYWCWKDFPVRRTPMDPYLLPDFVYCWPMAVPSGQQIDCQISHSAAIKYAADAWRFLLLNGQELAEKFHVKPEELMCITRAGTNQNFYINDFGTAVQNGLRHSQPFGQQRPSFGFSPNTQFLGNSMFPHQSPLPTSMYLLTSLDPDFVPYWSHSPTSVEKGAQRPDLKRGWTYQIGWCTGFVNWIQLDPEDFVE